MRIIQERDQPCRWGHFPDGLDPFACDFRRIEKDPCHIAAGPVEALRRPNRYGICFEIKRDDGDGLRGPHRGCETP